MTEHAFSALDSLSPQRPDAPGLPSDAVLGALADARRRYALDCLRRRGGWTALSDVAADVRARERDVADGPRADGERVGVSLHHVHLPKLAAAGLVEYDADRLAARPTADADRLTAPSGTDDE